MQFYLSFAVVRGAPIVLAVSAALIVALAPAARAQTDFDANGATIGVVAGNARVGFNVPTPPNPPITVTANSGTSVGVSLNVYNSSTLNMSGGHVVNYLSATDNSVVNLSGGTVGFLSATDSGVVNLSGGYVVLDVYAQNSGVVNFSGGTIGFSLYAQNSGVINITGGGVIGDLFAQDSGVLCLFGTNLSAAFDGFDGFYNVYTLSGFLSGGTDLTGETLFIENNGAASFKLINASTVPEPGAIAFGMIAAGGVLGMIARKRG